MHGEISLLGLVSLFAFALPAVNAFATTGCYPAGAVTDILSSALTLVTTGVTTPSACATTCAGGNRDYGYFNGNINTCYCTDLLPLLGGTTNTVGTIVGGVGPSVCAAGDLQGLDVNTPFTDLGCAFPADTIATGPVSGGLLNVLSISSCLDACTALGLRYSFVTNLAVTTCQCATNVQIASPSICGLLRNYVYVNLAPVPSGTRKRTLEAQKRSQQVGLCPAGLQSCRVAQGVFASDDFECLDVNAELESCGGCTAGIMDGDAHLATSGVDCTAIPGVEMGAVSCVSGQCSVSKCKSGYALVDNTCVSTRSVAAMALGALRLQNL